MVRDVGIAKGWIAELQKAKRSRQSCNTRERSELRRALAVTARAENRHILELGSFARMAQQQPTAAHVATADESDWKSQAGAKDVRENIDVLRRRDAAKQHDVAVRSDLGEQRARARLERPAVRWIVRVDVSSTECLHRCARDERIRTAQAGVGGDDMDPQTDDRIRGLDRLREPTRVRKLAAKIQAAHETEQVAERRTIRRS